MTRNQISIRRIPLLKQSSPPPPSVGARLAEAAGVTAADCAAVACCCPCVVLNLLVLVVFKLPAGIYKRATRRRRRRKMLMKRGGVLPLPESEAEVWRRWGADEAVVVEICGRKVERELVELEREMRERFFSSGFWRTPSQRSDT